MQMWWAHILCQYLPLQLNYFRVGQRCSVYIHGRRFFNSALKVLGLKRFVIALLTLLEKKKHLAHFIVIFMIFFLQEDDKIIDLVNNYGPPEWSHCKVGKQCRERYSFDCFIFVWFAEMHFAPLLMHYRSATRTSCCWSWDVSEHAPEHVQFIRSRIGDYCAPFMIQCS